MFCQPEDPPSDRSDDGGEGGRASREIRAGDGFVGGIEDAARPCESDHSSALGFRGADIGKRLLASRAFGMSLRLRSRASPDSGCWGDPSAGPL